MNCTQDQLKIVYNNNSYTVRKSTAIQHSDTIKDFFHSFPNEDENIYTIASSNNYNEKTINRWTQLLAGEVLMNVMPHLTVTKLEKLAYLCDFLADHTRLEETIEALVAVKLYNMNSPQQKKESKLPHSLQDRVGHILCNRYLQDKDADVTYREIDRIAIHEIPDPRSWLKRQFLSFFDTLFEACRTIPLSKSVSIQTPYNLYLSIDTFAIQGKIYHIETALLDIISLNTNTDNSIIFGKAILNPCKYGYCPEPFLLRHCPTKEKINIIMTRACFGPHNTYYYLDDGKLYHSKNKELITVTSEDAILEDITSNKDGTVLAVSTHKNEIWYKLTDNWNKLDSKDFPKGQQIAAIKLSNNKNYIAIATASTSSNRYHTPNPIFKNCYIFSLKENNELCTIDVISIFANSDREVNNTYADIIFDANDTTVMIKCGNLCIVHNINDKHTIQKYDEDIIYTCLTEDGLVFRNGTIGLPAFEKLLEIEKKHLSQEDTVDKKSFLTFFEELKASKLTEELKASKLTTELYNRDNTFRKSPFLSFYFKTSFTIGTLALIVYLLYHTSFNNTSYKYPST
jgi:hypothetical protein